MLWAKKIFPSSPRDMKKEKKFFPSSYQRKKKLAKTTWHVSRFLCLSVPSADLGSNVKHCFSLFFSFWKEKSIFAGQNKRERF